jgi:hypothetical protein
MGTKGRHSIIVREGLFVSRFLTARKACPTNWIHPVPLSVDFAEGQLGDWESQSQRYIYMHLI